LIKRSVEQKEGATMHLLSLPKKFGIAMIALFLALAMAIGISARANAVTGSSAGCEYEVDYFSPLYETSARAYMCSTVDAFLTARDKYGTTLYNSSGAVANPVGEVTYAYAELPGSTVIASYAQYNPGRGGVPSFTIHAV
jgi:hypothetical protein